MHWFCISTCLILKVQVLRKKNGTSLPGRPVFSNVSIRFEAYNTACVCVCVWYLLGEGGVCIVPVLGVLAWLGSWLADWFKPLRLNWGAVLLFIPRMGNPKAPTARERDKTRSGVLSVCRLWKHTFISTKKCEHGYVHVFMFMSVLIVLCGPYKLAPSCDSWPVEEAEEDASI